MEHRDDKGRFVEGHPGGPGRPKGISLVSIIRRKLSEMDADGDRTVAEALIAEYIEKARAEGDGVALRDLIDRIDGKPTNRHEIEAETIIRFDAEDEGL